MKNFLYCSAPVSFRALLSILFHESEKKLADFYIFTGREDPKDEACSELVPASGSGGGGEDQQKGEEEESPDDGEGEGEDRVSSANSGNTETGQPFIPQVNQSSNDPC